MVRGYEGAWLFRHIAWKEPEVGSALNSTGKLYVKKTARSRQGLGTFLMPDPQEDKGTLLGTPNREPQEYSRNIMEY